MNEGRNMESNWYRYETHLHTKEASACSATWASDYIDMYHALGYSGIIVTDHFYHGNTAIDRSLKWNEWVDQFCLGYEHAKEVGDKKGLQVFFGLEENFSGDEYLIYGLNKQWLYEHPEMKTWDQKEQYDKVHAAGGLVIQAHPYRERGYLSAVHLHPYQVDGIEVSNAGNEPYMDAYAYQLAKKHNLSMLSGSDMHMGCLEQEKVYGVAFQKKLTSIHDFVRVIKEKKEHQLLTAQNRFDVIDKKTQLPIYFYDDQNNATLLK